MNKYKVFYKGFKVAYVEAECESEAEEKVMYSDEYDAINVEDVEFVEE